MCVYSCVYNRAGFINLMLSELRWDTLSAREYSAFERLYRGYNVSRGGLRYAPPSSPAADGGGSALSGFLSKLWRGGAARRPNAEEEVRCDPVGWVTTMCNHHV